MATTEGPGLSRQWLEGNQSAAVGRPPGLEGRRVGYGGAEHCQTGDIDLLSEVLLDVTKDLVQNCDHGFPFRIKPRSSTQTHTQLSRLDPIVHPPSPHRKVPCCQLPAAVRKSRATSGVME